jgi:hypothetical protein
MEEEEEEEENIDNEETGNGMEAPQVPVQYYQSQCAIH